MFIRCFLSKTFSDKYLQEFSDSFVISSAEFHPVKLFKSYTHRNFVGASNLLWGLVQSNTDLVESTSNFGRANPHFWQAQPKNNEVCGNQNFWLGLPKFLVEATKFFLFSFTKIFGWSKFLVSATSNFLSSLSFHRSARKPLY